MIITPPNSRINISNQEINIGGNIIERVGNDMPEKAIKFLGIYLDEHISWKHHIKYINGKISRSLFAIKQLKNYLPLTSLRNLYIALIHPHILYGILLWGNAREKYLNKTILLQKRAIRTISKASYNSHTEPLLKSNSVLNVRDLYEYQMLIFWYNYENNKLPNTFR